MAYGNLLADVVQGSTANTPPVFKDGSGTEVGTLCRAWVNFNGTGTVAIRASFNVSSITDNGTGKYTINFTTAMPDANYAVVGQASNANYLNVFTFATTNTSAPAVYTASAFQIGVGQSALYDAYTTTVSVFR